MSDRSANMLLAALRILLGAVITINIIATTWLMTTAVDHGKELAAIKANRFTAENGLQVWKEIAKIREQMPDEVPPRWFLDKVNKIETDLTAMLKEIESEMKSHQHWQYEN